MRPNLLEQLHDCFRSRKLDLPNRDRSRRKEFRRLAFEGVEGKKAKQLVHDGDGVGVEIRSDGRGTEGIVEAFDD